jgi:hypothetical protein
VLERTLEKVKRKQENTPRKLLRAQRTLLNANRKLKKLAVIKVKFTKFIDEFFEIKPWT